MLPPWGSDEMRNLLNKLGEFEDTLLLGIYAAACYLVFLAFPGTLFWVFLSLVFLSWLLFPKQVKLTRLTAYCVNRLMPPIYFGLGIAVYKGATFVLPAIVTKLLLVGLLAPGALYVLIFHDWCKQKVWLLIKLFLNTIFWTIIYTLLLQHLPLVARLALMFLPVTKAYEMFLSGMGLIPENLSLVTIMQTYAKRLEVTDILALIRKAIVAIILEVFANWITM